MTPDQKHLVIFSRNPRLGTVKQRLARDIGTVAALGFYRTQLQRTVRSMKADRRWRTWLAITPDSAAASGYLWPDGIECLAQGTGDLGQRMARIFEGLPPGPAIIVGTDIPEMKPRHVTEAFNALKGHDAVFGPSADGGYWLIGFRRFPKRSFPFVNVRWSSPDALADTVASLPSTSRIAFLETLADVDTGNDWQAWRSRTQRN